MAMKEKLWHGVETVKGFCCLDDRLNTAGGSKPLGVVARTKTEWVKCEECYEVL